MTKNELVALMAAVLHSGRSGDENYAEKNAIEADVQIAWEIVREVSNTEKVR